MIKHVTRALALAMALAAPLAVDAQTHKYNLNGNFNDTGTPGGQNLTGGDGTFDANGFFYNDNGGPTLSNVFGAGSAYSIRIRHYFNSVAGFQKIVDFKDWSLSTGAFSGEDNASVGGTPYFATGSGDYYGTSGKYVANQFATTLLTRTAGANGVFSFYVDGDLQFSFIDSDGSADFTEPNGIAQFFASDNPNDLGSGYIDDIEIFDYALNSEPVSAVPEPASVILMATGLVGVIGAARRRRRKSA